ncbi:FUSC family protein [Nonomuraea sp. NPDC046570]|uniref:FUSC family protein n=1 Tax=Nonomuraea sp. NPDC046570 TaxID=3155255 RepID=UPI0034024321
MNVSAAGWLRRAVTPSPAPISWPDVLRAAVGIGGGAAAGVLLASPATGLLLAMGALGAVLQRTGKAYRLRLLGIVPPQLTGALGLLVGHPAHGTGWGGVLTLIVVALVSGAISSLGPISSACGLSPLLMATIGVGLPLPVTAPLPYLAGGALVLLLALLGWPVRPAAPERRAVADVYRALAGSLGGDERARERLPKLISIAQDALVSHRATRPGQDSEVVRLTEALNAATPLIEASTLATVVRPEIVAAIDGLADAVAEGRRDAPPPDLTPATREERFLLRGVRYAAAGLGGRRDEVDLLGQPPSFPERFRDTAGGVLLSGRAWRYALRLALCVGLASGISAALVLPRGYWVTLTVTFVLKPDFGSVFTRALLRALGTLVGVTVGVVVLTTVPLGWPMLTVVALLGAVVPIVSARSYAMQTAAITPLVIVLIDWIDRLPPDKLATTRLLDTLLGCAIVLVFGYALWPESWRVRVGERLADLLDDVAGYLLVAFGGDPGDRSRRRRAAYRRATELDAVFQQALTEPPPASAHAAAWWPALVAAERMLGQVTAASVRSRSGGATPAPGEVTALADAVKDLAGAAREQHRPGAGKLPEEGPLAPVADEIRTARAALG